MMRVAIIGCGQLARMLALAGKPMGIGFCFVACDGESVECVEGLGDVIHLPAGPVDAAALYGAMGWPDVVTVERENISIDLLGKLQNHCPVHPNPEAVGHCQNRLRERRLLRSLNIATAPFVEALTGAEVEAAANKLGLPVVVKDARSGYDGKHQWRIHSAEALHTFLREHSQGEWLVEKWVAFDREVSLIAARSTSGETAVYPVIQNWHDNGVLRHSLAPAGHLDTEQENVLVGHMSALLEALDYVGILTVECFLEGRHIMVNELAPRVHNSGHWTHCANVTSQFENHLRAILGLPLGDTRLDGCAGMVNMLGVLPGPACYAALSGRTALHWYDKRPRPGRKLGHVAVAGPDRGSVLRHLHKLHVALYGARDADACFPEVAAH